MNPLKTYQGYSQGAHLAHKHALIVRAGAAVWSGGDPCGRPNELQGKSTGDTREESVLIFVYLFVRKHRRREGEF